MIKYTAQQKQAIDTLDQNLQIIACAGSGKTQVISQRVVNILKSQEDITPGNIVAFTYTEKAAAELKYRILKLCKEQLGEVKGLAEMYVGTIHSWCLKVLQAHIFDFQKFSILDEIKLRLFVDRHYKKIGMVELEMQRYKDTLHFISLMTIIRESDIEDGTDIPLEIQSALKKYEKCLTDYCYFDFTMIMTQALAHLKNNTDFRQNLQSTIKYLIVDEYQDVNPVQEKLIYEIYQFGANICTVGDDDQTIYQWRGSDIENILLFSRKYQNVKSIRLEDNFRSSKGIIQTSVNVIRNNGLRLPKSMNASGHQQYERGDLLFHEFSNVEEESQYIASTIRNLRGHFFQDKMNGAPRGLDYSDFAILLRKWKKANPIIEALKKADIPFIVAGVNNLFDQPEVQAARAIFLYLGKQIDTDTLKEFWLDLSPKIDKKQLELAIRFLNKKSPQNLSFYDTFNLQDIFKKFLHEGGIREACFEDRQQNETAGNSHQEIVFYNLGMFSQVIDDFETIHFMNRPKNKITNFLNFLKYSADDYYPEGWLHNTYKTPNAVQIMTIHQSKGLEFPAVFIPGMNRNYLPSSKRGGKSVWHFLDKSLIKGQKRYEGSVEDERRLLYVAMTRSQKFLFISRAPDGRLQQKESAFCAEIRNSDFIFSSSTRNFSEREKLTPACKPETDTIELNFTVLKTFFECPYCFKFLCMYGFKPPLDSRMGYGLSIHNVLMEIHRKALDGQDIDLDSIPDLLQRHFHLPHALDSVIEDMRKKAGRCVDVYYKQNQADFNDILFSEKDIQLDLGDGILVNGRMDLIKKKQLDGTYQTTIIDFKSATETQLKTVSLAQLSLYALDYQALTGEKADFLQIYNLDDNTPQTEKLQEQDLEITRQSIIRAANRIRNNQLDETCGKTDCDCRLKHQ